MPSLSLGQAVVELIANTVRFNDQLASAHRDFTRFANSVKQIGATLGVGFSVAGLVSVTRQAIAAADAIDDMADRLRINAERLQEFQFAARSTGAGIDDLQTAMRKFAEVVTDASRGIHNEAADAFVKLVGASTAASAATKTLDEGFLDAADAIAKIENPAAQAAAAVQLFGRGALQLLPTLRLGRDGFEQFAAKAREMGHVLDSATIKRLGDLNDRLELVGAAASTNMQRLVNAFEPAIKKIIDYIEEAAKKWGLFIESIGAESTKSVEEAARRIARLREEIVELRRMQEGRPTGAMPIVPRGTEQAEIDRREAEIARRRTELGERLKTEATAAKITPFREIGPTTAQVNLLEQWAAKLRQARLPEGIDREIDKLQTDIDQAAKNAGGLAGNIREIGTQLIGLARDKAAADFIKNLGDALKPPPEAVSGGMTAAFRQLDDALQDLGARASEGGDALAFAEERVRVLGQAFRDAQTGAKQFRPDEVLDIRDQLDEATTGLLNLKGAMTDLARPAAALSEGMRSLDAELLDIEVDAAVAGNGLGALQRRVEALQRTLAAAAAGRLTLKPGEVGDVTDELDRARADLLTRRATVLEAEAEHARRATIANDLLDKGLIDATTHAREMAAAHRDLTDALRAEEGALTSLTENRRLDALLGEPGTMLKATEELAAIRQELEKLRGTALEGGDTWERMLQKYRDTRPFAEAEQVIDALFQSFNQALATSIQGVILGTQTLDEALRNLGQNVGLQMLQMGIKRALDAIEQMLIDSIERGAIRQLIQLLVGLGISSYTGGTGVGPVGSSVGTGGGPGAGGGGAVPYQHGGIITRRTNLYGEAGAEAIIPLTRGNLSQYGWGGGAGGGQHMTVELINESGTPLRAERPEQTLDANGMQKLRVHIVKIVGDAIANSDLDGPAGAAWGVKRQGYRR